MKSKMKQVVCLLIAGMLTATAQATVVFQDSFNYPDGTLTNATWVAGAGNTLNNGVAISSDTVVISGNAASQPRAYFTNGLAGSTYAFAPNFPSTIYVFSNSAPVAAIYYSFQITVTGATNSYFAYLCDTNFSFVCRLYATTNTAAVGQYRIGVGSATTLSVATNSSGVATNIVQQNLAFGTTHTIVARYVLATGLSTVWVDPVNEASTSASATFAPPLPNIAAIGLRGNNGTSSPSGSMSLVNLIIGTLFSDVLPSSAGSNPPFFSVQPQDDPTAVAGDNVTFSLLAGGDQPFGYQWFSVTNAVTNAISGATSASVTLNSVITNQAGSYFCVVTNAAGTNITRSALLSIFSAPVAVVITNQPQPLTVNVGDTATFTVVAGGVPPPTYQWFTITNSAGTLKTNIITGATTSTLTLTNVNVNLTNSYMVTATNRLGATNSTPALLTITPIQTLTIAQLRSKLDGSFNVTNTTSIFTIQGTVTTWTNMTTSTTSLEFYMQDSTAGIAVFWSGANPTNLPLAGAVVKVTGPMAQFNGLVEIEPVFSNPLHKVTVISTGNPLPAPQPLPFDPNVTGNMAQMKAMESSYFVASNVTLAAGTTFGSGANEPITANASNSLTAPMFSLTFTNLQGEQFTLFINGGTDIPGQLKPTGPVTIFGVLGFFTSAGFEFTPSRFADIISYLHVTNIMTHARPGDLATNTYLENVVRTGESLATHVSIGDAAGGVVTLTPTGTLPTGATWSGLASGTFGTGNFTYTGSPADAGTYFPIQLIVSSTAGTLYTNTFSVYVPTLQEQQIAITEFLANPATNPAAGFYNPLQRASAVNGISTNDQYIELANQSGSDLTSEFFIDKGLASSPVFDSFAGFGVSLLSSNALVVYGGNGSPSDLPTNTAMNVAVSSGLFLPATGNNNVIELRNSSGYIIDRIIYSGSGLSTNGSLARFPTWSSGLVPQTYISTNLVTPGLQYDGGAWNAPTKVPAGVTGVGISRTNGQTVLKFSVGTKQAYTLWDANPVNGPYNVIYGQPFPTASGSFTNVNSSPIQFYYITTQ
jgi:hypothetical protein